MKMTQTADLSQTLEFWELHEDFMQLLCKFADEPCRKILSFRLNQLGEPIIFDVFGHAQIRGDTEIV